MINRYCVYCDAATAFQLEALSSFPLDPRDDTTRFSGAFLCQVCRIFQLGRWTSYAPHLNTDLWTELINQKEQIIEWSPRAQLLPKKRAGVPEYIQSANAESSVCLSAGAYKAAVLMARSTIEAVCKDKGVLKGRLVEKIDQMHEEGYVRESVKTAAHAVRQLGNDMAHGDIQEDVSEEDAQACLTVLDIILADVYEVDQLAGLIQDRVTERKP